VRPLISPSTLSLFYSDPPSPILSVFLPPRTDFPFCRPDRYVTALGGVYPAWFDIRDFPYDPYTDRDYDSLFSAVRMINRLIYEERALLIRNLRRRGGGSVERSTGPKVGEGYATSIGPEGNHGEDVDFGTPEEKEWASKRIVLSGFSQGGVVSLLTALTHPLQLGGLVCFSSFLPLREDLAKVRFFPFLHLIF
jgi:hypothetical protein